MRETTAEQRQAWAEVHNALANYIIHFGSISIEQDRTCLLLDYDSRFIGCGKIYTPEYSQMFDPMSKLSESEE